MHERPPISGNFEYGIFNRPDVNFLFMWGFNKPIFFHLDLLFFEIIWLC